MRELLALLFSSDPALSAQEVEQEYARALEAPAVLLIPSVRAGILMSMRAACGAEATLVGPAFTCDTVHEALALSGASYRLVDSAPDSFLVAPEELENAWATGCALLLSEVYGLTYDPERIKSRPNRRHALRIFDLAQCIPSVERIHQLGDADVALYSFGWGKSMYAGWGSIACFQNLDLAAQVRKTRDAWVGAETLGLRLGHASSVAFRVALNQPALFGLTHEPHLYRLYETIAAVPPKPDEGLASGKNPPASRAPIRLPDADPRHDRSALPAQWTKPSTSINRKLAMYNLHHAASNAEIRRGQAELYCSLLVESGVARGPGRQSLPQSHFPIRVPSALRDRMRSYLRMRGVDTGRLWPFPAALGRTSYPQAALAADEVITLPLGPGIGLDDVRMISGSIKDGMELVGRGIRLGY